MLYIWQIFLRLTQQAYPFPRAGIFTLGVAAGLLLTSPLSTAQDQIPALAPAQESNLLFLPLITRSERLAEMTFDTPIWPHADAPAAHEVALFRHHFSLATPLTNAELHIFADTRYELWVDGQWQGRGPARFSQTRHEYDVYGLGDLPPGDHLIAVLVQWAPNTRRAESTTPHLLAHIEGQSPAGQQVVARTDSTWKAKISPAWRQDAAPVHEWQILGPTELLDLRQLPADWMLPGASDVNWPYATARSLPDGIRYTIRTIPLLSQVPITPTVLDAGLLSPGRTIGQLAPTDAPSTSLIVTAQRPTTLTLEMLNEAQSGTPPSVFLSGQPLTWNAVGPLRPDVQRASTAVAAGAHTLQVTQTPAQSGPVVSIAQEDGLQVTLPFDPGNHAGRRVLLAEPVSQPGPVLSSRTEAGNALYVQVANAPAYVVIDLGRVVHGRLVATVTGPAGTVIDVGWDERLLTGSQRPLPHPGSLHREWNQVDSWVLDGTPRTIRTIDARAGRYLLLAVWGAPVELRDLQVLEERYPVTQRGWFRSSNARLDRIWQLGVDTLYPSLQDGYVDPWRERGQWWGDAYVANRIEQVAFGDSFLLRRGLLYMAESLRHGQPAAFAPSGDLRMLDYSMLWAQNIQDYLEWTDDQNFGREIYPALKAFMAHLAGRRNPTTGLLDIPPGHWTETSLIDWAGNESRYGQSTALNALYYGTLLDAAAVADRLVDRANADRWRQEAEELQRQINSHLYLADQGRYGSSIVAGQMGAPTTHAQAWALAFGVAPAHRVNEVATALFDPFRVEIFGMYWVLEGLGNAGRVEQAVHLIEQQYGRLLEQGATTLWEHWDSILRYQSALSHSWGGAPTWFLTTRVLGAQRSAPNGWIVQPAFAGVEWAAGALPLPVGDLQVEWRRPTCAERSLLVNAPTGSQGKIRLLSAGVIDVRLNGLLAWAAGNALTERVQTQPDWIEISSAGGRDLVEVSLRCGG